jgi:hypothetical protein
MRKLAPATFMIALLLGASVPAKGATVADFYVNLLRRGVSAAETGRYDDATTPLRIAAFGLVDALEQYQLAQAYLAVSYDKLAREEAAREAARRVVAAERIEPHYRALPAPARSAFDVVAKKLLTNAEVTMLGRNPAAPSTPLTDDADVMPPRTTSVPQTTNNAAPQRTQQNSTPQNSTATPPRTTTPRNTTPQPAPVTPTRPTQSTDMTTKVPAPANTNAATNAPHGTTPVRNSAPPAAINAVPPSNSATTTRTTAATPSNTAATAPRNTTPSPSNTATTSRNTTTTTAPPRTTPTTAPATLAPPPTTADLASRFAAAERALARAQLTEARGIYRGLLDARLDHDALIRVAEGFYRARDFSSALIAFARAGTLRGGEEPYHYYIAVALYETGAYVQARRELAAALPYIEITADVARYRAKIEGAVD